MNLQEVVSAAAAAREEMRLNGELFKQIGLMCEHSASAEELAAVLLAAHQGSLPAVHKSLNEHLMCMLNLNRKLMLAVDLAWAEKQSGKGVH